MPLKVVACLIGLLAITQLWLRTCRGPAASPAKGESPPSTDFVATTNKLANVAAQEIFSAKETKELQEKRTKMIDAIAASLQTPITFYGKVIDQYGDPVPNARVGYSLLDKFMASGTTGRTLADADGTIHITGLRGAEISVGVLQDGYYLVPDKSKKRFAYDGSRDPYTQPPPTRENPAVLVLHKMGETEPLLHIEDKSFRIPKDGTPVRVELLISSF
jgi:uncharacterized protein YnzC (UPF0291/DUF896 family)